MTLIKRKINPEAAIGLSQFRALCLTGPRQSGKTTLTKQLATGKPYVNFENPKTQLLAEEDLEAFIHQFEAGAIFDEVQRIPDIFRYLQIMLDANPARGQFILTGSNNFLLQEQVSQSLAGRAGYLTLLPLSFAELKEAKKDVQNLHKLIFTGGYPEIWHEGLLPEKWHASYLQTYVQRDVRLLRNISNLAAFNKFIHLCANMAGQIVNRDHLARNTGVDAKTIHAWLGLLENSYIIFQLQPYYKNLNKRIIKSPKLYFYDTGLLCHLLGLTKAEEVPNMPNFGALFENWIIAEIRKNRFNQGLADGMYYFRDQLGNEVDLIIEKPNAPLALEIKATKNPNAADYAGLHYWKKLQPESNLVLMQTGPSTNHDIATFCWNGIAEIS